MLFEQNYNNYHELEKLLFGTLWLTIFELFSLVGIEPNGETLLF